MCMKGIQLIIIRVMIKYMLVSLLVACVILSSCNNKEIRETSGGWIKYANNPILGGDLGTIFDVSVLKTEEGIYRMYCSWRPQKSIALSESSDGYVWSEPVICLRFNDNSHWEKNVNRPVILRNNGLYHMWYTGQTEDSSRIGYAVSNDGRSWERASDCPVLLPDTPWEKVAVMCPHVIWDEQEKLYKMWYSGGEQYEPDAIGYATSPDGLSWTKYTGNPVFINNEANEWEQYKVTACQVIKRSTDYLMFYIGFRNIDYAQIGMARSKNGITGWERYEDNPVIKPGNGWDSSAVYKPFAMSESNCWVLYYNGRRDDHEQIGCAVHDGPDLGF